MSQATVYTFDEDCFSDLHKDAMGFRPNTTFWEWLREATDAEKQAEWDSLIACMDRRMQEDAERERECIIKFEATVATTIASGAGDRATAIRWLKDAEGNQYVADEEYFEWLKGIPYGYIKRTTN